MIFWGEYDHRIEDAGVAAAAFRVEAGRIFCEGDWIIESVTQLDALDTLSHGAVSIDVSRIGRIDVAGAYALRRLAGAAKGAQIEIIGDHPSARRLLTATQQSERAAPTDWPRAGRLRQALEDIGRWVETIGREGLATVAFLGQALLCLFALLRRPRRIRWTTAFSVMEVAGLNALPIVALLSFFVGVVVAYLGARTLGDFGVSVFTVELVGVSVLREFAVVITAVLLAGRTDSAFTAEIGAMKMRQEIDAMRVLGLDPIATLVVPRLLAMLLMLPILTFGAMVAGLLGGLVACWAYLDVSPAMFIARIQDAIPVQHFWVGMSKSPIYGIVLAVVGCRHGLAVGGDVGSLGRRVTSSVVEAIFLIILLDALFAVWFLELDL